jgi:hypothetical protein
MPLYTFVLISSCSTASDETGIYAPDREQALAYGQEVARELMQGREDQTRSWRLDIYENGRECVAEIPFTAIDPALDHTKSEHRRVRVIEHLCDNLRSWQEALRTEQITMWESRALVVRVRVRGKPYVATIGGRRTIR